MSAPALPTVTYASSDSPALEAVHAAFEAALARVRTHLGMDEPMRIGGEPVTTGRWIEDRSPIDPTVVVARVPDAGPGEVDRAVAAARGGFRTWRRTPWRERLAVLGRAADLLDRDAAELAAWLALEVGKSRMEAFGEASELPTLIRYYCDQVESASGFERDPRAVDGETARVLLRPHGVWAIVSPFNFPLAAGAGMAAGALAAGNAVVMKPASDAPLLTLRFVQLLEEAGLPAGVASAVTGRAEVAGAALVGHSGIDGVAFTGSVPAGQAITATLAASPIRRPFIGEMGGKNAVLVVGDPTERATFVGPVINGRAAERYEMAVRDARRHGRVDAGGRRSDRIPGFLLEPTVVTGLPLEHRLLREELFLPLLPIASVPDMACAIEEANATPFGLCGGLFSQDEEEIARFFDEVEAGVLYVNRRAGATSGAWPGVQPFTGWKASGSSGKGALGPWYVQQFMREQAQTRVDRAGFLST